MNKKFLGIIPARGGSKTLPRKNILPFCGKPLLIFSFDEIKKSKYLDKVVVSTEDEEIKSISRQAGIEVVDRPPELAEDDSPTEEALIHVVNNLLNKGERYDYVVTLEPTSPLRKAETIDRSIEHILTTEADSLVSVSRNTKRLGRDVNGEFKLLFTNQSSRRQDREPLYEINSLLFITKVGILFKEQKCIAGRTVFFETNPLESIDINDCNDFKLAESIYKLINNN